MAELYGRGTLLIPATCYFTPYSTCFWTKLLTLEETR